MKKISIFLMAISFVLIFTSCASNEDGKSELSPETENTVAIEAPEKINEPYPEDGETIALIDGREFCYDPNYEFMVTGWVFPLDPAETTYGNSLSYGDMAVLLELIYQEAKKQEDLSVSPEEIAQHKEFRKNTMIADTPGAEEMLESCLESQKISEAEYWQNLDPYIAKYLLIEKGLDTILPQNFGAEAPLLDSQERAAYLKECNDDLKDIYDKLKTKYKVEDATV